MAPRGQKPKYTRWITPQGLKKVETWAGEGLYDQQIAADKMGISPQTLCEWKNKYPELSEALQRGRDKSDNAVENAIFKAAIGFETSDEKIEVSDGPMGRTVKKTSLKRSYAPNMTAAIFWMKNRRPDRWKDVRDFADSDSRSGEGINRGPGLVINYDYGSPPSIKEDLKEGSKG